jgi:HEAT repeat protein
VCILVCLCLLVYTAVSVLHYVRVSKEIGNLKDEVPALRQQAAEALGQSGNSRAVEPLIAALSDPEISVRGSAATALGAIKDPRALEPLQIAFKTDVKNDNYELANIEAKALGSLGTPALQPLLADLNDKDLEGSAGLGLVTMGAPAVEPLIALFHSPDPYRRQRIADWLGEIKDPRAVDPLIAALNDSDADVRKYAALSLGQIKDSRAVAPLIALLNSPPPRDPNLVGGDSNVRNSAAFALGSIGSPEAVNFLLAALHQHNTVVIAGADNFFILRAEPGSEDALIDALNKSGDHFMAEDFLNSGNEKLHDAASSWASRNNYDITYMPSHGSTSWGGKQ